MNMKIKIEQEPSAWHNLSMRDRAKYIHNSVQNHFANGGSMTDISIDDIRHQFNDEGEKDIYTKANAILDKRIKQKMMENRPSYEDWINNERNKITQAAFEYSNQRTSPSYIMQDNPYKTEEEWTLAMDGIIAERQKELNDSIKLNANQPPMIQQMNISIAQQKLDDAIWEKNQGYSSKIPANSCLTTATDNYVQVTGDKSYGANLNSYFQNNHPGYEVVPGFEEAALGDIVQLLEDNGEAKHGMIYAGQNDQGQYIFNNSAGGPDDIAYQKGISFRSINNDKNPNDHVQILRFIGNDQWNKEKEEDYNLRYPTFIQGSNLFDEGGAEKNEKKTLFEPIEHPVIPEVPSDQDTMDWLANWYNNRRKQLYNNRIQARKNLLTYSSLPSSISDLINNYEIGRTELNKEYYRKLNSLAYPVTMPVPEEEYYTPRFYGNAGINKRDTIFINYNHITPNSKQELETKVHERVHSLQDPGYFRGFNEQTDITNDILVPKEPPSSEYDKYLNDGREGYPRLMEFRRIHDIDPNKVWNVEEVKQLLEQDEKDKDEHQLYKWTPESVTKALNEIAYRNQNNAIIQAANGGTLLHQLNNGSYLFAKGGPKDEQTLADGKVEYSYFLHPIDAFRYNGSPSYNTDIPFATAFTDAIRNNQENFQWGNNIYNTDIDWKHHFSKDENGNSPFKEFAEIMYPAVIKVLQEQGLPITNAHNIVRQAAIESNYGTDPRGAQGYNLSGIKWTKSADPKYKHTTGADGEEYIDFDNLKDYIYYKVKILNDNYDALNAKNAKDFARRLHPNAAGIPTNQRASGYKGDYSGDYNSYKNNITNLNSLDKTLFHQMYKPLFGK